MEFTGRVSSLAGGKRLAQLARHLPALSSPEEMFVDMVQRTKNLLSSLPEHPIRLNVATICSGSDAPLFALDLIQNSAANLDLGPLFEVAHLFSCEIEPFKQAFIRRNVSRDVTIFRDVVELASRAEA